MLRIAVQSKGRLFDDTMNLLAEADIKISASNIFATTIFHRALPAVLLILASSEKTSSSNAAKMPMSSRVWVSHSAVCRWPFQKRLNIGASTGSMARRLLRHILISCATT